MASRRLFDGAQIELGILPIEGAAAGAFTLVADGGTYTYTGNNATLTYTTAGAFNLPADGGTYSYTGNNANLLFNRRLAADGGVYSYTGNNANLTYTTAGAFVLQADGGVYTYSGNNANLLFSGTPIVVIDTHDGDEKRRKRFDDDTEARKRRRAQIQEAYETLLEDRPQVVEAIVAPFTKPAAKASTAAPSLDFDALLNDLEAAEMLYAAYLEMDDEEVLLLL